MTRLNLPRRALALGAAGFAIPRLARAQPARATDLRGREIVLDRPARRVVLAQGRHLAVLNLLLPDPVSVVAGWAEDMKIGAVSETAAFLRRFPQLADVPTIGRSPQDVSVEAVIAQRPDLVLCSRVAAARADATLFRALDAARIPHAVVDFFADPLRDTVPSLRLLGALLGCAEQAAALVEFITSRLDRVHRAMDGVGARRSVLMHAHAGGTPCCSSPGRGVFDGFITLAGGRNIGADRIPGPVGSLSYEYVLSSNPDVYIATGGSFNGRGGVLLGADITEDAARASLNAVINRDRLNLLGAVRGGRAHALWHGTNDSPTSILAIELLVKWIHPERARDIDPAADLAALNQRFAAVPMEGTYWVDLAG